MTAQADPAESPVVTNDRVSFGLPEQQPIADPVVDMSRRDFNADYFKVAFAAPSPTTLPELGFRSDAAARPTDTPGSAGDTTPSRFNFRNIDASPEFFGDVQRILRDSAAQLNPAGQRALDGVNVITASRLSRVIRGEPDSPGLYALPGDTPSNSIIMSERGLRRDGSTLEQVLRHELGHPLDAKTGASRDPEFRAALEKGMQRLPAHERQRLRSTPHRQAEIFADLVSANLGSRSDQLGYIPGLLQHFPEANEWVRRRFFQR